MNAIGRSSFRIRTFVAPGRLRMRALGLVLGCLGLGCASGGSSVTASTERDAGNIDATIPALDGAADSETQKSTICERYLGCAAATNPTVYPTLQAGYGKDGTCWKGTSSETCEQACRKGLSQLRAVSPFDLSCGCEADSECLETNARACDPMLRKCGSCKSSASCGQGLACVRSRLGPACQDCADQPTFDSPSCGVGPKGSPDLWSASPFCALGASGPTCTDCANDGRCNATANCNGVWECLRNAPVECSGSSSCCKADKCPAFSAYGACMAKSCGECATPSECIACSRSHCKDSFSACQSSCR